MWKLVGTGSRRGAPLPSQAGDVHWSLIRARKHYPSHMLGGGATAVVATAAAWKIRPPRDQQAERAVPSETTLRVNASATDRRREPVRAPRDRWPPRAAAAKRTSVLADPRAPDNAGSCAS